MNSQRFFAFMLLSFVLAAGKTVAQPVALQFHHGDHVAYIGNALADRMQHSAWLETLIHASFPESDLTFRNLGFPGDELTNRLREDNFGSPDQWLTKVEADVVFCFFGYNEALKGEAGLEQFRKELATTIEGMLSQKYNGSAAPQLVFFSPLAHEDLHSSHLPDGSANNVLLELYTAAMQEVCEAKNIIFVDLFHSSKKLYLSSDEPLTMNGIHLLEKGDRAIAKVIMNALFPNTKITQSEEQLERLRSAVLDKNDYWFNRYRVVDGYNVFGGRSKLAWFGQSNADVMMREMEIFDVMTANRDVKVWAVARGSDHIVVDNNLPKELEVQTNIPGSLSEGKHQYLGGEEAIEKMKIAEGMEVNLYASEEMFPEIVNPVQMAVDPDGRLFVSVWPSYPHWNPTQPRRDRIVCLPDDNGDGVADRCVTFADNLNSVTGFEFWGGGMLVAALPEIWFLKDTDGDDKADLKIRMLQGVSSADSHHSANAVLVGPDGWLYWSRGIFNTASIETPTKTFRSGESGVHRFNPRTFEMEFHFPIGPNPHGDVFDQWGFQFANDGTGGVGSYVNIGKGISNKPWFKMRVRPVAATGILSSSQFPDENQGNFLVCNCIGFLGVLQHQVHYDGADITATEIEPILVSSDPNFRPTDVEIGGDGALYVSDWSNAIIGHMQHNMRDPNRDHQHGRIYRVTAKNRPLVTPVKLRGKSLDEVCKAFYSKENGTRYRARLELSGRSTPEVMTALTEFTSNLDPANPSDAQALLECLWVCEEHRSPNGALLKKVYAATDARVRAAAIRTLGHWTGGKQPGPIDNSAELVLTAARDDAAIVRAEAIKAAVNFDPSLAAQVVFEVAIQPTDAELDTVLAYGRAQSQADQQLQQAIEAGSELSPAAIAYALRNASLEDLTKLPKTKEVYGAILNHPDATVPALRDALSGLSKLLNANPLPVLFDLIEQRDIDPQSGSLSSLAELLLEQSQTILSGFRSQFQAIAETSKQPATRQLGYAAWITADGNSDAALVLAIKSKDRLRDFLLAVPQLPTNARSENLFAAIRSLMFELPPNLPTEPNGSEAFQSGIQVDYYFPNPKDVSLETLAKLKPQESGLVPTITMDVPQRKEPDTFALRFSGNIIVPTSGAYQFFIASDDGSRLYVDDKLLIDNDRLQGMTEMSAGIDLQAGSHKFAVTYYDNGGGDGLSVQWSGPSFAKQPIAADRLAVGTSTTSLHDLAILAVSSLTGNDAAKFTDWTRLIKADRSRPAVVTALRQLPETSWDMKELPGLVDNLVGYLSGIPAKNRTSGTAVDTVELIKKLATRLPDTESRQVLDRLQNLDVRTVAIGTVIERMAYDKVRITAQAGKPIEFRFSNTDNMPHNFVILQPGALEQVGLLAESTALEQDARDRQYVPVSDQILLSSELLNPGQSQTLSFEVPSSPGMYPYVCTYPGHWRRMFGVLVVVSDYDAFQADSEGYLAANPMPFQDALLETIGRDVNWQYTDFADDLQTLDKGRSFEVGKSLFTAANCIGCHKLGDQGREFGPDFTKLDARKSTPEFLLRSILEPSAEIDPKYQSQMFLMDSGAVITGMVVEENDKTVSVLVDPLAKGEPLILSKDEIEERKLATVSAMPQGLLSKLNKEEVLDLLAFVAAKGEKSNEVYSEDGHHHDH